MQPLIGISTHPEDWASWGAVQRAGGLAATLPTGDPATAAAVVSRLDGLMVAGGPDVEPSRYGAKPHPRTGPPKRKRDAWELALIEAALAADTPLLGICRGLQLLNVVRGGTLAQHIEGHLSPVEGQLGEHPVKPVPLTRYASLVPEQLNVLSQHHQSVDRLGEGLEVCAVAEDGTVEAIELPGATWIMGVQWHPELADDPRVMAALIEAASA